MRAKCGDSPPRWIIWKTSCRTTASRSARCRSPISPSPAFSAQLRSDALRDRCVSRWPLAVPPLVAQACRRCRCSRDLARFEDCMLRLPLAEQRAALITAGAPLTSDTLGTSLPAPRRGAASRSRTAGYRLPTLACSLNAGRPVSSTSQSTKTRSRAGICRCGGYSTVIGSDGGGQGRQGSRIKPFGQRRPRCGNAETARCPGPPRSN